MTKRNYCLWVVVKDEIQRIVKENKTVFDCTLSEALKVMSIAQAEWKEFYTGCDAMDKNGRCQGHPSKD